MNGFHLRKAVVQYAVDLIVIKELGTLCVGAALLLDTMSYWKQLIKVVKLRHSNQVSTSAYLYKIGKALALMLGLAIYVNWVGFGMELFMLIVYVVSLVVIARFKPKGWSLFKRIQNPTVSK